MKVKNPWKKTLIIAMLVTIGLLIIVMGFIAYRLVALNLKQSARPLIEITSPKIGDSLTAGESAAVLATVKTNGSPVNLFEFYVDGILAGSRKVDSEVLTARWEWRPQLAGTHRLSFLAENAQNQLTSVEMDVVVGSLPDEDGDGVPDESDACPDVYGTAAGEGCALPNDRDGDGITDTLDACPDAPAGDTVDGCPAADSPDRDRDGYPDASDRCPDEAGAFEWEGCPESAWMVDRDGDGVPDFIDTCPDRPGPAESGGCEGVTTDDRDGDGVSDALDACVDVPGSASASGCPLAADSDSDGMGDSLDACPDSGGLPGSDGCPPEELPVDSDGDGVVDAVDLCPDTPGTLDVYGCPLPDDSDGDGVVDEDDNCPDIPGPAENHGCIYLPFPFVRVLIQDILFPELVNPCRIDPSMCIAELEHGEYAEMSSSPNDSDSDGVFNDDDDCPFGYGEPRNHGCPDPLDTDFDGVIDSYDQCDHEPGPFSNRGCPRPEGRPADRMIEFYIQNVRSNPAWSRAYCYLNYDYDIAAPQDYMSYMKVPGRAGMYQLQRESGGGEYRMDWTAREASVSLNDAIRSAIMINCWGYNGNISDFSQPIGSARREFGYDAVDGQIRSVRGETDFGWFEIDYRICPGNCP